MTKLLPAGEVERTTSTGSSADPEGPVALRPRLAAGLPLLRYKVSATNLISAPGGGHFRKSKTFLLRKKRMKRGPHRRRGPLLENSGPDYYLMSSKILNIGMYRAMTMDPTIPPKKAIMIGSISATRDSVIDSTSWS
jgi:hypothetical protein